MISGYGSTGPSGHRVAFGDDAAVAGGLVSWDGPTPCFCGDAVADPVTGLAATAAVLAALEGGGARILEASMADVAGGVAGAELSVEGLVAVPPGAGRGLPLAPVPALGADTDQVLHELGIT